MIFEAFWKNGSRPEQYRHFNRENMIHQWMELTFLFPDTVGHNGGWCSTAFVWPSFASERVALVLWGFCSLPKRGRPENDKKRQTFLGRQGSRSWNDPYLPGSLMSWASWVWSCRSLGAATKTGWRRPSPVFRDSSDSGPRGFSRLA